MTRTKRDQSRKWFVVLVHVCVPLALGIAAAVLEVADRKPNRNLAAGSYPVDSVPGLFPFVVATLVVALVLVVLDVWHIETKRRDLMRSGRDVLRGVIAEPLILVGAVLGAVLLFWVLISLFVVGLFAALALNVGHGLDDLREISFDSENRVTAADHFWRVFGGYVIGAVILATPVAVASGILAWVSRVLIPWNRT